MFAWVSDYSNFPDFFYNILICEESWPDTISTPELTEKETCDWEVFYNTKTLSVTI